MAKSLRSNAAQWLPLFEYQPQIDTKISKIIALEDDLALALQATSIRIIAPIPGRSVVGFEVANKNRRERDACTIIKSEAYQRYQAALPMVLGVDTIGNPVIIDLAKMPHLLDGRINRIRKISWAQCDAYQFAVQNFAG